MLFDILIGICTGLLSGVLSGYFVYLVTKKREKNSETYRYCMRFLFMILQKCEMYVPYEELEYFSYVNKDKNSVWQTSIQKILDLTNPFGHEDKVFSEDEKELTDCVINAIDELNKWKKKNHIN